MYSLNNISPNVGLNGISEQDARRMLKGYRFFFKVPLVATMTDEEIELFGVPVDVKPGGKVEYNANKNMTTVYYDLSRILDIYKDGHTILLVNRNDITKILEILSDVANRLEGSVVKANTDLVETIDDFIHEVLQHNRITVEHKVKQKQEQELKETGLVSGIEVDNVNTEHIVYQNLDGIKVEKW